MKFIKNHPLVIVFVLAIAIVAGASINNIMKAQKASRGFQQGGDVLVALATVALTELTDEVESVGTAQANESVVLTAKVTDTISKIHFEDGDYVETGHILVELTNSEETAQLAEAQASVDETSRQYRRVENLIAQKLASETQLDIEKARMQTANARLEAIVARLDDRLIRAPFSGLLGFRNVSQGTLLSPTTPVTTLDDISLIKLDFSIPERYFSAIKLAQAVKAKSPAYPDIVFEGFVATVNSRIDPVTRSVSVRAHLDNENRLLRPGMLLNVQLTIDRSMALVIPEEAIIPIQNQTLVFVVNEDMTVARKSIETGRRSHGVVEVLGGLTEGQQVVTQGIIKLNPGSRIRTAEIGA